ncbi:hypothetical protein Agub_g3442, partial [Astrephomene gubernaculifera]
MRLSQGLTKSRRPLASNKANAFQLCSRLKAKCAFARQRALTAPKRIDGIDGDQQHPCPQMLQRLASTINAAMLSMVLTGSACCLTPSALASNVRLADVESPELRAGIEAATNGDFAVAETVFARMLSEDPSLASVWSNLGNVHMSQGRPEQALQDYSRAVQLAPYAPVPYLNRAIALEQLGVLAAAAARPEEAHACWQHALSDCDTALQLDPKEAAAWFNKGNVQLRLRDWAAAAGCFVAAADLAPGIPGYRLRAAQLQFQTGDVAGAVRITQGVIRKNPNYAEAHLSLAAMRWSQG